MTIQIWGQPAYPIPDSTAIHDEHFSKLGFCAPRLLAAEVALPLLRAHQLPISPLRETEALGCCLMRLDLRHCISSYLVLLRRQYHQHGPTVHLRELLN